MALVLYDIENVLSGRNGPAPIFYQCRSTSEMRKSILSTDNVIIVMPAKAAGTSFVFFSRDVMANNTQTYLKMSTSTTTDSKK